jgi:hypothetical protein
MITIDFHEDKFDLMEKIIKKDLISAIKEHDIEDTLFDRLVYGIKRYSLNQQVFEEAFENLIEEIIETIEFDEATNLYKLPINLIEDHLSNVYNINIKKAS